MSKPARITILCEDLQQACFVRRFLLNRGWTRADIREPFRLGGGSGEQRVREEYPRMLRAYRSKANHLRNGLVVVIDADTKPVAGRIRAFDAACDEQGVPRRRQDERVLYVIPKRNIETWLAYLRGEQVDENRPDPYPKYKYESQCHAEVDKLDVMCKTGELDPVPPPSLQQCCEEFQAFWQLIQ